MKTTVISLLLTLLTTTIYGQELSSDFVIGTWEVVDSAIIPEMKTGLDDVVLKRINEINAAFIGMVFHIKRNGEFTADFPENMPKFLEEMEYIKNRKWIIKEGQKIAVGSEDDNYSIMVMIVQSIDENIYFILDETPYVLKVARH